MDEELVKILKDRMTILLQEQASHLRKEIPRIEEDHAARGLFRSGVMIKTIVKVLAADHNLLADKIWNVMKPILADSSITYSDDLSSELKAIVDKSYSAHLDSIRRLSREKATSLGFSGSVDNLISTLVRADDLGRRKLHNNIELFCFALRDKTLGRSVPEESGKSGSHRWDVFICHASEDSKDVAAPLAAELQRLGWKVWFDKYVLRIGDSLVQKIDEGLVRSRYGIVILSPSFFAKVWARKELDGLVQKEMGGRKVILPVWHEMTREEIASFSPTLAGRLAGTTLKGIGALAEELVIAISEDKKGEPTEATGSAREEPVAVSVGYTKVYTSGELHRYSLVLTITLGTPPAKSGFLLKLQWPKLVRISKLAGLTGGSSIKKNRIQYSEYALNHKATLYPGQVFTAVAPEGPGVLEYEFDGEIWDAVDEGEVLLFWEIYFEDQMPSTGHKDFKELNWF